MPPGARRRILVSGVTLILTSTTTHRALLGLLLLALASAPLLATCDPAADEGCCCHKGKCGASMQLSAQSCCNSGDSIPAPAPAAAPGSAAPQVEDLPPKPEVADCAARDAICGDAKRRPNALREVPPELYTLHASLLI